MRRLGLALAPLVVATAGAQDAAPPAPAPAPPADAPKIAEFLGPDAIRKTDGLVVHYYRVNYVDAKRLATELDKWKASPKALITADEPAVMPAGPLHAPRTIRSTPVFRTRCGSRTRRRTGRTCAASST